MPRVLSSNTRNTHIFGVQGGEVKKMGFASQAQGGVVGLHRPSACGRSSGVMGKARPSSSAALCIIKCARKAAIEQEPRVFVQDGPGKTFFVSQAPVSWEVCRVVCVCGIKE